MTNYFHHLGPEQRDLLVKRSQPDWTAPMLARLTDKRFSYRECIFERKFDGERALAFRSGDRIRLMTRNRKPIGNTYPELVDAFADQRCSDFVLDGEIVAFDGSVTSFSRLQQRMQIKDPEAAQDSGIAVYYYLFDILHLDGYDVTALPLRKRKNLLKAALKFDDPIRFSAHRNEKGEAYLEEACKKGWEGIIAKRAPSPYQHKRSGDWLKFKCAMGQELVIGGFTTPRGSRKGFGALLVGYYQDGKLRYAGKVGTGYDDETLISLGKRLDSISRETSPFADEIDETDLTWVRPELVGAFGFTEWTRAGKLRQPRFLGLRRDKDASEVVRETPGD